MRAFYREPEKVRIHLPPDFEVTRQWDPTHDVLIVSTAEWTELETQIRDGDPVRAELKRSLDAALSQIERLSDERDELKEQAELWRKLAERQDNTAPLRTELRVAERERDELRRQLSLARDEIIRLRGLAPAEDDIDELKAVIVSQAREIARLKGESE